MPKDWLESRINTIVFISFQVEIDNVGELHQTRKLILIGIHTIYNYKYKKNKLNDSNHKQNY